jgi:hypothetical protein
VRNGTIKVDFKKGKIVGVSINPSLDVSYERLFKAAREAVEAPTAGIDAGVQVIVFGCFWLEAVCNQHLRTLLCTRLTPARVGSVIWERMERTSFLDKLCVLHSFEKKPDAAGYRELSADAKRLFDLRNRLAHFKDQDTPIAGPMTLPKLMKLIPSAPDPGLTEELCTPKVRLHADSVIRCGSGCKPSSEGMCRPEQSLEKGDDEIVRNEPRTQALPVSLPLFGSQRS